jgi:hypothetical protein
MGEQIRPTSAALNRGLRQRVRSAIGSELVKRQMWQSDDAYIQWRRSQLQLGKSLSTDCLSKLIGPADYNAVRSTTSDGILDGRLARSAPSLLAFGYTLGHSICAAIESEPCRSERSGVHSAIFNFGIALFDFLLDSPSGPQSLHDHWDSNTLTALCRDQIEPESFLLQANATSYADVRVLYKVIGAFFAKLLELRALGLSHNAYERLVDLLSRAYEAEMQTIRPNVGNSAKLAIAADKSILPFMVIGALAWGHAGVGRTSPKDLDLGPISQALGTTFWLADDLADIAMDYRCGALNSLLVRAELGADFLCPDSPHALEWLMESNAIDEASEAACHHAALACSLLEKVSSRREVVQPLRVSIANYVRSWIY